MIREVGRRLGDLLASRIAALISAPAADSLDAIPRQRIHPVEEQRKAEALEGKVSAMSPQDAGRWVECGARWFELDQLDRARRAFEQALAADPRCAEAMDALGTIHKTRGEIAESIELYRRALAADPRNVGAFQNLLFAMLCSDEVTEDEILREHRRFAEVFETPLGAALPERRPRPDPDKRLRVAYLSADLRDHVTGRCIAPILANHDRKLFKVSCYYDARKADDFTRSMQRPQDNWRDISHLDDAGLCARIRSDEVDILVDLSGHTPGNRILAFARRSAPIQVSYLDYSATTGLQSMDYRLTTALLDADGSADAFYTEALWRLPANYWAYNPPQIPDTGARDAAAKRGGLLFSCLNSFYRIPDRSIRAWAQILRAVPGSRLALIGIPGDAESRDHAARRFKKLGIDPSRLEIFGILDYGRYLQLARATDVALAPYPYNGAMTTLDCLWNSVPVVCLRGGPTFRSSMGRCILELLQMDDLVAASDDDYVRIATGLARDTQRRAELRAGLRGRMKESALCDGRTLTRQVEKAYREMWRRHCAAVGA